MAFVREILQHIIDHPGQTTAEIADALEVERKDIQPMIHSYIKRGLVMVEKKPVLGGQTTNIWYAAPELPGEIGGIRNTAQKKPVTTAATSIPTGSAFSCGFFTDGRLVIAKGKKRILLSRDEAAGLIKFLDSINVDRVAAGWPK